MKKLNVVYVRYFICFSICLSKVYCSLHGIGGLAEKAPPPHIAAVFKNSPGVYFVKTFLYFHGI